MRELDINIRVQKDEAQQALADTDQAFEKNVASAAGLKAQLALAEVQLKSARTEVKGLADQLVGLSETTRTQLQPELTKSSAKLLEAEERVKTLGTQLKTQLKPPLQDAGTALDAFATKAATAFAGYLAAQGVLGAIQRTSEFANNLQRQSSQTQISTMALQEYGYAAKLVNVPIETLTTGVSMLERRIASDPNSVQAAFRTLGQDVETLRRKQPEDVFNILARAITGIEDPYKRAQVAQDLFGRGGAALLPVMENLDEVRKKAHEMGAVMDDRAVAAMGRLNNQLDTMKVHGTVVIAEVLTPMISRFEQLAGIMDGIRGKGKGDEGGGMLGGLWAAGSRLPVLGALLGTVSGAGAAGGAGLDLLDLLVNGQGGPPGTKSQAPGDAADQLAKFRAREAARIGTFSTVPGGDLGPNLFGGRSTFSGAEGEGIRTPMNPNDPKQLADLAAGEKAITDEVRNRIEFEKQENEITKLMFLERLRVNREITKEIEKQVQTMAGVMNSVITQNLNARERNNAAAGLDVYGNPSGDTLSAKNPYVQYQQRTREIGIMQASAPGADVSALMLEASHTFTNALLADAQAADAEVQARGRAAQSADQLAAAHAAAARAADQGRKYSLPTKDMFPTSESLDETLGPQGIASGFQQLDFPGARTPLAKRPSASGGFTFGDIHIHGNVDSELRARQVADQTSEQVVRRILAQLQVPLGRS